MRLVSDMTLCPTRNEGTQTVETLRAIWKLNLPKKCWSLVRRMGHRRRIGLETWQRRTFPPGQGSSPQYSRGYGCHPGFGFELLSPVLITLWHLQTTTSSPRSSVVTFLLWTYQSPLIHFDFTVDSAIWNTTVFYVCWFLIMKFLNEQYI